MLMTATARLFDEKLPAFKEQQNAPWGRLRYGLTFANVQRHNNDIKSDPAFFAQLERLEYAMSDKYPYHLLARYFQVIGRKTVL